MKNKKKWVVFSGGLRLKRKRVVGFSKPEKLSYYKGRTDYYMSIFTTCELIVRYDTMMEAKRDWKMLKREL